MTRTHLILASLVGSLLTSCAQPGYGPNAGYFAMDPAQAEANRQNTHRIEQEGRDMDHQERMRRAQATELATRHNPTHVTENRTSFWIW